MDRRPVIFIFRDSRAARAQPDKGHGHSQYRVLDPKLLSRIHFDNIIGIHNNYQDSETVSCVEEEAQDGFTFNPGYS